jgi:hypothetical protein
VSNLNLSISVPKDWKSIVTDSEESSKTFSNTIAPGESVSVTFQVTSGSEIFNGDLVGQASWTIDGNSKIQSETAVEKVRNVNPIRINEFRISDGTAENSTNSFIELYNTGDSETDISNWTLTHHQTQMPVFSCVKIPAGTKLAAHGFYLLGLSNSGLAVPAKKGESTIYIRSTTGMSVGDVIEIGSGSAKESRKIAGISAPSAPEASASPFGFGRRGPLGSTTVWQPLPEGPVIDIPAGSTNIPVTSVAGFESGQKMAIGYGASYPAVAQAVEKYEVATITEVGKQGTQAWLSMDAKPGETSIKVSSVENISTGDKIRLDIASEGHGIETVTVTRVGTQSSRSTFNGPLTDKDDPGTGFDLAEPLKFNHSSNLPFSARGTGISFEPASSFVHSSNEPVLALRYSITLDQPLANDHQIDDVVRDEKVTTAGYQGTKAPDQWFGGPTLSASAGNMMLRDADGNVVDGLNYGGLVDPWAAEGYQATSGAGANGCIVTSPSMGRGFRMGPSTPTSQPNRSAGRFPDGKDTDSNCSDFLVQSVVTISAPAAKGSNNIKVSGVRDFVPGQKIIIGSGTDSEYTVIASVGTPGGSTVSSAARAGTTVILVSGVAGFNAGQTINIGNGANLEMAIVANITPGRRRFGAPGSIPADTITVAKPLKYAHSAGAQVSGSGITLATPMTMAHEIGTQVAANVPTPGESNQYFRKP